MTVLKPYPAYKHSGLVSLNDVPGHWTKTPIKAITRLRSEKGHPNRELLSVYREYGVIPKSSRDDNHNADGADLSTYKAVEVDDLVINKMKAWQGSLGISRYQGIVSPAYIVADLIASDVLPRYLHRLLRSRPYVHRYNQISYGIREGQWDMRYEDFKNTHLFLPPLGEQRAIADFLDGMDARITRFIAARRKMIALLEERKQAVINQAVIRGLDPDVPMKDSGVDWLGEIPAHWNVRRLKHIVQSIDQGVSPQAEARLALEDSWGVLKSGCVNGGVFRQTEHKRLPDDFVIDPYLQVRVRDVLVSRASGSKKFVGSTGIVQAIDFKLILSDKTFRLNFLRNFMPEFYVRAMNSTQYRLQVEQEISGAEGLANNLPLSSLREFLLPVPSVREQQAIVRYLDLETVTIDMLISRHKDEIELVQEYRTRLISDVVTGKLDVRGVELPAIEEVIGEEIEAALEEEQADLEPVVSGEGV